MNTKASFMSQPNITAILADIGNSRIKLAAMESDSTKLLPLVSIPDDASIEIEAPEVPLPWFICSVSPSQTARLKRWIKENRPTDDIHLLSHQDIPLEVCIEAPEKVGVDRLMAATAAQNTATSNDVVIIDAGTAVTIDAISGDQFLGGTISPGSQTAFESLRQNAEQLPLIDEYHLPERVIGKSTSQAIQAGVMFGQIGSIRYVAEQVASQLNNPTFVATGGGLKPLMSQLPTDWNYIPDLVLDGIRRIARTRLTSE